VGGILGVLGVGGADNDALVLFNPVPIRRSANANISAGVGLLLAAAAVETVGGSFLMGSPAKTAAVVGVCLVCGANIIAIVDGGSLPSGQDDVSPNSGSAKLDIVSGPVRRLGVREGAGGKLSGRGVNESAGIGLASIKAAMASISAMRRAAFPISITVPISDAVDMTSDPPSSSANKDAFRLGWPLPLVELEESSVVVGLWLLPRCAAAAAARCKLAAFRGHDDDDDDDVPALFFFCASSLSQT